MMRPVAIVCGIVLGGSLQARHARAADTPASPPTVAQQVQQLDDRGQEAYRANELEQACGWWSQAFALQPSADLALSLGRVEISLKHYRDAAEHFDYALRRLPDSANEKARSDAKKGLAEARTRVGALEVTTTEPDVELRVDGKVVGTSPLAYLIYLEPGTHQVSAHLGSNSIARAVTAQPGQEAQVNLPLVVQTRPIEARNNKPVLLAHAETGPGNAVSPSASDSPLKPLPLVIGGTLLLAGVASGVVFRINSNTHFDDAEQMRTKRASAGCVGTQAQSTECQALLSATQSGDRARNWSNVGFAVGGAALIGSLVYWFWPRHAGQPQQTTQASWQLEPNISANGSGLLLSGKY